MGTCVACPVWLLRALWGDKKTFCWKWPYISHCLGNYVSLHLTLFVEWRCPTSHELPSLSQYVGNCCSQSYCVRSLWDQTSCWCPLLFTTMTIAALRRQHLFVIHIWSRMWPALATYHITFIGEFLDAKSITRYQSCSVIYLSGNKKLTHGTRSCMTMG